MSRFSDRRTYEEAFEEIIPYIDNDNWSNADVENVYPIDLPDLVAISSKIHPAMRIINLYDIDGDPKFVRGYKNPTNDDIIVARFTDNDSLLNIDYYSMEVRK